MGWLRERISDALVQRYALNETRRREEQEERILAQNGRARKKEEERLRRQEEADLSDAIKQFSQRTKELQGQLDLAGAESLLKDVRKTVWRGGQIERLVWFESFDPDPGPFIHNLIPVKSLGKGARADGVDSSGLADGWFVSLEHGRCYLRIGVVELEDSDVQAKDEEEKRRRREYGEAMAEVAEKNKDTTQYEYIDYSFGADFHPEVGYSGGVRTIDYKRKSLDMNRLWLGRLEGIEKSYHKYGNIPSSLPAGRYFVLQSDLTENYVVSAGMTWEQPGHAVTVARPYETWIPADSKAPEEIKEFLVKDSQRRILERRLPSDPQSIHSKK